jgi:hypothetical protein
MKLNASSSRMRCTIPWVVCCCLVLILALVSYFCAWEHKKAELIERALGEYNRALVPAVLYMHGRDTERAPGFLHVLQIGPPGLGERDSVVQGVSVHSLAWDPDNTNDQAYVHALRNIVADYNKMSLGQACDLALSGEISSRVEYVLRTAEILYKGSYESRLYSLLPKLASGDKEARGLFQEVLYDCGEGRDRLWRQYARGIQHLELRSPVSTNDNSRGGGGVTSEP